MLKKSVLITGSSKGLGKSLALEFAKNNYDIILHGRDKNSLMNVQKKVLENNVESCIVQGDLTDSSTISRLVSISKERGISVLINNAAIDFRSNFENFALKDLQRVLETNLIAPIKLIKGVYTLFAKRKYGTIININSLEGLNAGKFGTAYSTSKFGLRGFTDALKIEARPNNVIIMNVFLTGMNTDMYEQSGKDRSKGMNTSEVSEAIFKSSQAYPTTCVEDITLNRSRYL